MAGLRNTSRASLEAAIVDNPDDVELWLVYADALQECGDPRGELIERCHRDAGVADYLREHPALVPPGDVTWRFGFVDRIRLAHPSEIDVITALDHPSCRFVRQVALQIALTRFEGAFAGLAARARPTVRVLAIEQDRMKTTEEAHWLANAPHAVDDHAVPDAIWAQLPALWRLIFDGGWDIFERVEHPLVEEVVIDGGAPFCALEAARPWFAPALRRLVWHRNLDCTGTGIDADIGLDFLPLWKAEVPCLRELDLRRANLSYEPDPLTFDLFEQLVGQLEVLRMSCYALGETPGEILERLREHAELLAPLQAFTLTRIHGLDEAAAHAIELSARAIVPGFSWS